MKRTRNAHMQTHIMHTLAHKTNYEHTHTQTHTHTHTHVYSADTLIIHKSFYYLTAELFQSGSRESFQQWSHLEGRGKKVMQDQTMAGTNHCMSVPKHFTNFLKRVCFVHSVYSVVASFATWFFPTETWLPSLATAGYESHNQPCLFIHS